MLSWTLCLRIVFLILAWYLGYETRPVVDNWRTKWQQRERVFPVRPESKPTGTDVRPRPLRPFRHDLPGQDSQLAH